MTKEIINGTGEWIECLQVRPHAKIDTHFPFLKAITTEQFFGHLPELCHERTPAENKLHQAPVVGKPIKMTWG